MRTQEDAQYGQQDEHLLQVPYSRIGVPARDGAAVVRAVRVRADVNGVAVVAAKRIKAAAVAPVESSFRWKDVDEVRRAVVGAATKCGTIADHSQRADIFQRACLNQVVIAFRDSLDGPASLRWGKGKENILIHFFLLE